MIASDRRGNDSKLDGNVMSIQPCHPCIFLHRVGYYYVPSRLVHGYWRQIHQWHTDVKNNHAILIKTYIDRQCITIDTGIQLTSKCLDHLWWLSERGAELKTCYEGLKCAKLPKHARKIKRSAVL